MRLSANALSFLGPRPLQTMRDSRILTRLRKIITQTQTISKDLRLFPKIGCDLSLRRMETTDELQAGKIRACDDSAHDASSPKSSPAQKGPHVAWCGVEGSLVFES